MNMIGANVDFDKKKNVIIYPFWNDEFGISVFVNIVVTFPFLYGRL